MAELYDRFASRVYSVGLAITRDPRDAEEVVSDTLLHVWESAGEFDRRRGTLSAWIVSIARSRSLDRHRKRVRRETLQAGETDRIAAFTTSEPPASPDAATGIRTEFGVTVAPALAAMPVEQRRAIELAYFGGMTQSEISRALDVPLGTVKTRLRTGLLGLRAALGAAPEGGGS